MQLKAYFLQYLGEFTNCEEPSVNLYCSPLNFIARILLFSCGCHNNLWIVFVPHIVHHACLYLLSLLVARFLLSL